MCLFANCVSGKLQDWSGGSHADERNAAESAELRGSAAFM